MKACSDVCGSVVICLFLNDVGASDILGNMELVQFHKHKVVGMMTKGIFVNKANLSQASGDTDVLMSSSCSLLHTYSVRIA